MVFGDSVVCALVSGPRSLDGSIPIIVIIAVTVNARPMPVIKFFESFGVSVVYPPIINPETS